VPLHASTTQALRNYARLRDRHFPEPKTAAFFVTRQGARLTSSTVHNTFPKLIRQVGLEGRGQRTRPRPHDLRHAFAVRTLLGWYRQGATVERELPLLSAYLGHVHPSDTYWYLQAVPELLELVGKRLDGLLGATP
jgi:integrase/recombinase XerD